MEDNLPALLESQIDKSKASKIKAYPVHSNRASQIGHPCFRYLVLERTRWSDKLMHEVGLQYIFDEGNEQEKIVIKTLMEAGFDIAEQQRSFVEKKEKITGHIDLIMTHPKVLPDPTPTEIKSISPFNFVKINTYSDIVNSKHYYVRNYAAQLQLYLYMTEYENGLFIFKNKSTGRMKFIQATIDLDYIDALFEKAKRVNAECEKEVINHNDLEATDDISICQGCAYRHICFKDRDFGTGVQLLDDTELEEKLVHLKKIEGVADEYKSLKEELSEQFKEMIKDEDGTRFQYMLGDYVIDLSKQVQNRVDTKALPQDIKDKYTKEINITKLNKIIQI